MTSNRTLHLIKIISLHLLFFSLAGGHGSAQDKGSGSINQSLRRELLEMKKEDQKYRVMAGEIEKMELAPAEKEKRASALWEKQRQIDERNIKRLAEIIEKYGWPGHSLVGRDASVTAFLVVQHADLHYQKKYFPLLKEAVSKGEADRDDAALLEDRILMREGKKQIYGTQLHYNQQTRKLELWPIEDEENVDARRASVGLGPIADYLKQFGLEYKPTKK